MQFPNASNVAVNMMYPIDFSYWEKLKAFIDYQPIKAIPPEMRGMAASLGMIEDVRFNPDPTTKEALIRAVTDAQKMIYDKRVAGRDVGRDLYYSDRHYVSIWHGITADWYTPTYLDVDSRAQYLQFAYSPAPAIANDTINQGRPPLKRQGRMFETRRRDFIMLLGGAVAWPLAARVQEQKVRTIGALVIGNISPESFWREFRRGLHDLGYIEGQNIRFEFRSAEGQIGRLPELAAELVRLKVDVIVTWFTPTAVAAKQATREIPIVMAETGDVPRLINSAFLKRGGRISSHYRFSFPPQKSLSLEKLSC